MSKLPVGLQIYGLRDLLEANSHKFKDYMQQVKDMGYDGIELAGLYGIEPSFMRDTLAEIELVPIGAHVPLVDLITDADKVVMDYMMIGVEYVVVPYLPEKYRHNTPGYPKAIEEIKRIGEIMKANGIKLLYHNHDFEFVVLQDGTLGLDDIYASIPAHLLMAELDACWIKVAGQDPVDYIRKYGSRSEIVHLKDFIKEGNPKNLYDLVATEVEEGEGGNGFFEFRPVGFGQMLWEPILEASLEAGVKWLIVEQDEHYGLGSLEAARRSREYLKILGW